MKLLSCKYWDPDPSRIAGLSCFNMIFSLHLGVMFQNCVLRSNFLWSRWEFQPQLPQQKGWALFFCLVQFVSNCYDPSDGQLDFLACFQIVRLLRPDASSTSPKTKCWRNIDRGNPFKLSKQLVRVGQQDSFTLIQPRLAGLIPVGALSSLQAPWGMLICTV